MSAVMQPGELTLRSMRITDIDRVIEVEHSSYDFPWSVGIFHDCLNAGYHCEVLLQDNVVLGFAIVTSAAGEAHLLNLCVHADFRGYGFGGTLLSHVMVKARQDRCRDLFLEVRPSNAAALTLYQRFGFRHIGRRPKYYRALDGREDALVLAYSLADYHATGVFTALPAASVRSH